MLVKLESPQDPTLIAQIVLCFQQELMVELLHLKSNQLQPWQFLQLHAASCDLVNDFLHPPECMEKEDERILLLLTNLPCIWVACVQGMAVFKICAGCRSWLLNAATI